MTQHGDLLYFGHMLDMARTARRISDGVTREQFDADETIQLALVHALQAIGEAAGRVSVSGRSATSDIA